MVCQGASQSRFRALKHENGIAGKATIIVRVIACFQLLQDCQVVFFRLMVELSQSSSWLCQQQSPWESSAFSNCMIAPVEHRQHEFLPAFVNPYRVSTNLSLNGFRYPGFLERGLTIEGNGSIQKSATHFQTPLSQNECHGEQKSLCVAGVGEKPTCDLSSAQQKKFLIFDRSGNETRLIFSSLCPRVENLATPLPNCPAFNLPEESVGAYHQYLTEKQRRIAEQAWTKIPALWEESGENKIIDEVSEIPEDSEEINALLYSEDGKDDDFGNGLDDDCDDDEVSSGHSPLAREGKCKKLENQEDGIDYDDEVTISERSSKRRKPLNGECNKLQQGPAYVEINDGDLIHALNEGVCPIVGNKRERKDKIHDTLRILESMIPGLKSKDPLVILDEAISYLKCLKYNAESMSMEDPTCSSSYETLNRTTLTY